MNKHAVLEIIYYSKMSLVISLLGLIFVNSMLFMWAAERLDLIKPKHKGSSLNKKNMKDGRENWLPQE